MELVALKRKKAVTGSKRNQDTSAMCFVPPLEILTGLIDRSPVVSIFGQRCPRHKAVFS